MAGASTSSRDASEVCILLQKPTKVLKQMVLDADHRCQEVVEGENARRGRRDRPSRSRASIGDSFHSSQMNKTFFLIEDRHCEMDAIMHVYFLQGWSTGTRIRGQDKAKHLKKRSIVGQAAQASKR